MFKDKLCMPNSKRRQKEMNDIPDLLSIPVFQMEKGLYEYDREIDRSIPLAQVVRKKASLLSKFL